MVSGRCLILGIEHMNIYIYMNTEQATDTHCNHAAMCHEATPVD